MTENILSWRLTLIKEGEIGYGLVKAPLAPFVALFIPQLTKPGEREKLDQTIMPRGNPLYGLYRYVLPQRVCFFSRFGQK